MIARRLPFTLLTFAVFGDVLHAQESQPTSRLEGSRRFHQVAEASRTGKMPVISHATGEGEAITVFSDGLVQYRVGKVMHSDLGEPHGRWTEHYEARLPNATLARIEALAVAARVRGSGLAVAELLDLTRCPFPVRMREFGMIHAPGSWHTRHQDPDGSWSPADFDWLCDERNPPVCTGVGNEGFRLAATALMSMSYLGMGHPSADGEDPQSVAALKAIGFILEKQQADGSFAADGAIARVTNAVAAMALCRAAELDQRNLAYRGKYRRPSSRGAGHRWDGARLRDAAARAVRRVISDQEPDGAWASSLDESHRLSVAAWSLLALRSAVTAGIEGDPAAIGRGLAWIERSAAGLLNASPPRSSDSSAHARAVRAVARAAAGLPAMAVTEDVEWITHDLRNRDVTSVDAETLLFGGLAAWKIAALPEEWVRLLKSARVSQGCAEGSFDVRCPWSDSGGRLVSTALMVWLELLYYRYPRAFWLD